MTNTSTLAAGVYHDGSTNENAFLTLNASSLINQGLINAHGEASLKTSDLINKGSLNANMLLAIQTTTLSNSGSLYSDKALTLELHSNFTNEGFISSGETLLLSNSQSIINNNVIASGINVNGDTFDDATLNIHATSLTNNAKISSYGALSVHASTLTNQGYLNAFTALNVTADTLHNYGVLFSGTDMSLWVSTLLYNYENANILAIKNLLIAKNASLEKTQHIVNDKATIETIEGDISLYVENFENKTDSLVKETKVVDSQTLTFIDSTEIDTNTINASKQELVSQGKYTTIIGATKQNLCLVDSDGMCEKSEDQYNGISEKRIVVTNAYVRTWDTYDEDFPMIATHHSQQLYDVQVVSSEDLVSNLNTSLAKYGIAAKYAVANSGGIFGFQYDFLYHIPDKKGGEVMRQVTVTSQQESIVSQSPSAKLISGGKLSIYADTITNYLSQIASNDDMHLSGNTLNNDGEALFRIDTQTGQYKYKYKDGGLFGNDKYKWAPLPSTTTYTQTDVAYSLIYSAKNITGNLATVNNIDIKSNQAPLGHSATTNAKPDVTVQGTQASIDTTGLHTTTHTPIGSIAIDPDTHKQTLTLPSNTNGLFVQTTTPDAKYLIETNPAFTSFGKFIGSEYMLSRLGFDPDATIKRLGDAFFENRMVRDLVFEQTGKRYLSDDITSDAEQFQYLMDNALALQEELKLTPYVSLSVEQIASLTQDIVWMEKQEINGQSVLVPVVYIANAALKTTDNGAKIVARGDVHLGVETLGNQGDIQAGNDLSITAVKRSAIFSMYDFVKSLNDGHSFKKYMPIFTLRLTLDEVSNEIQFSPYRILKS